MEICQHCGMYMKPFVSEDRKSKICEFCGEIIAQIVNGELFRPTADSLKSNAPKV